MRICPLPSLMPGLAATVYCMICRKRSSAQKQSRALTATFCRVPGVVSVILMESINDIGHPGSADLPEQSVTAEDIIAGMRQIADRAREHGLRVFGATLTPYADTVYPGFYTKEGEVKRQAVNRWIRESDVLDGVLDFDAVVRDPALPDHIAAAYDCGDHLHPNDAGYRKMGEAIDLSLLRKK